MSKVENVVYKCTRSADGSVFAESVEMTVDCKENADILSPEMIDKFDDLADQMRNVVREKMGEWPVARPKGVARAPTNDFPKEFDEKSHLWTACPSCGVQSINYTSGDGHEYQKCPRCRIYLNEDGTTRDMPPRPTRTVQG